MKVETPGDLSGLKRTGRIVALAIKAMKEQVKPGITTQELDDIGLAVLAENGAHSAPRLVYNFPGATCISINNEAAHGIPGERAIQPGDLVNLDVSAELDGYFGDAAITVAVPPVETRAHNLVLCSQRALARAIQVAIGGQPLNNIGRAIEQEAESCGFTTLRDLGGHGVGRSIHEEPHNIACFYNPSDKRVLEPGMVLTIEPFITTGPRFVRTDTNGWTYLIENGGLSAQFEHTLVITKGKPVVVTSI